MGRSVPIEGYVLAQLSNLMAWGEMKAYTQFEWKWAAQQHQRERDHCSMREEWEVSSSSGGCHSRLVGVLQSPITFRLGLGQQGPAAREGGQRRIQ